MSFRILKKPSTLLVSMFFCLSFSSAYALSDSSHVSAKKEDKAAEKASEKHMRKVLEVRKSRLDAMKRERERSYERLKGIVPKIIPPKK